MDRYLRDKNRYLNRKSQQFSVGIGEAVLVTDTHKAVGDDVLTLVEVPSRGMTLECRLCDPNWDGKFMLMLGDVEYTTEQFKKHVRKHVIRL